MASGFSVNSSNNTNVPYGASGYGSSSDLSEVERKVLYGMDIRDVKAPINTLRDGTYQVAFADVRGREYGAFGMDEKLLSKHLVLLSVIRILELM